MSTSISSIAPQVNRYQPNARAAEPTQSPAGLMLGQIDRGHLVLAQTDRIDRAHRGPAAPRVLTDHRLVPGDPATLAAPVGTAPVRQRLYPAQLRRLIDLDLATLAAGRGHRIHWSGWDRSLPRLYLPVEPLARLLLESIDAITCQAELQANETAMICMRIKSLPVAASSHGLVQLGLDADRWECSTRFRGALNAGWYRQSNQAHLWQRIARRCDQVGGWLSIASLPGGGSTLQIHLPTDEPRQLIYSWLSRLLPNDIGSATSTTNRSFNVSLYAIGRNEPESLEQLAAANARLQSLARDSDYIYRVSHGRWIWLTTDEQLPEFVQASPWKQQLLDRWNRTATANAVADLVPTIEERVLQLIGKHIPPLDLRTQHVSKGPITRQRPHTRVDNPTRRAPAPTHLHRQAARWRYPI